MNTFNAVVKKLEGKYQIIRLDLPGFGNSQAPAGVWGLEDYSQFLLAFLTKINKKQIFAAIGHSNGGALIIKAVAFGQLVPNKIILLASSGIRDKDTFRRLLFKLVAKTGKVFTFWLPRRYKKILQKKLYGVAGSDMLVAPELKETFKKTVRQDVQADAIQIVVPVLLMYGQNDTATPPEFGNIFNNLIKHAKYIEIPNAGHFVHHDQTDLIIQNIQEFLE